MNPYRECLQLEEENQALRNQVKSLQFEILLKDLRASRCPASDRPVQGNWAASSIALSARTGNLCLWGASTYRSLNLTTTSSSCHNNRQQTGRLALQQERIVVSADLFLQKWPWRNVRVIFLPTTKPRFLARGEAAAILRC